MTVLLLVSIREQGNLIMLGSRVPRKPVQRVSPFRVKSRLTEPVWFTVPVLVELTSVIVKVGISVFLMLPISGPIINVVSGRPR